MAQRSYWQLYRRVRSNVDDHLSFINSEQSSPIQECILTCDTNANVCSTQNRANEIEIENVDSCFGGNIQENLYNSDSDVSVMFHDDISETVCSDDDELFESDSNYLYGYSSSSESVGSDSEVDDLALADSLCGWASQFNISLIALQMLLSILRNFHPLLPKDPRTLRSPAAHSSPASHRSPATPASSQPSPASSLFTEPEDSSVRQRPVDIPLRITQTTATRLFTCLEKIIQEQKEQRQLIQLLIVGNSAEEDAGLPEGVDFPLTTKVEVDHLDGELANSESFTSVLKFLSAFGGQTVKGTISRMMKEVMSNELARQYNLLGKGQKAAFGKLRLTNVLFKCLQRNRPTRNCKRSEMETELSKWLAGARDRDGGRSRRGSATHQRQETPQPQQQETRQDTDSD